MRAPESVAVDLPCGCRPGLRVVLLGGGASNVVRVSVAADDVAAVARHLGEDHQPPTERTEP